MARNKRIHLLASLTKGYDRVLDIGTDHGLVLKRAFDLGHIKQAIASDIGEKPLNQAKENLDHLPVTFIVSDGFKEIHEHVDLAIIAGMGATTISDILDGAPTSQMTYILQANDKHDVLRTYLSDHGFIIKDELIVHEGFYYIVMVVERGEMVLSKRDAYLGPVLQHKAESKPYYKRKLNQLLTIMKQADDTKRKALDPLVTYLKSVL